MSILSQTRNNVTNYSSVEFPTNFLDQISNLDSSHNELIDRIHIYDNLRTDLYRKIDSLNSLQDKIEYNEKSQTEILLYVWASIFTIILYVVVVYFIEYNIYFSYYTKVIVFFCLAFIFFTILMKYYNVLLTII